LTAFNCYAAAVFFIK